MKLLASIILLSTSSPLAQGTASWLISYTDCSKEKKTERRPVCSGTIYWSPKDPVSLPQSSSSSGQAMLPMVDNLT